MKSPKTDVALKITVTISKLSNLSCTQELLKAYVLNFGLLYGKSKTSYNLRKLLHLVEYERNYGTIIDNFSAYHFQHFLKRDYRKYWISNTPNIPPKRRRGRPRQAGTNYCEEKGRYKCLICSNTFAWKKDMQRHAKTHNDVYAYQCAYCDRQFQRKDKLKDHEKVHVKKKNVGEKRSRMPRQRPEWSFADHLYTAKPLRLIKCKLCDATLPSSSGLRQHMELHKDESTLRLDENSDIFKELCTQSDVQLNEIKVQICADIAQKEYAKYLAIVNAYGYEMCLSDSDEETVEGEVGEAAAAVGYECELCQEKFARQYQIFQHVKLQHAQQQLPYKCNVCRLEFVCRPMFERHERTQCCSKDKKHQCLKCPGKFMWLENLESHQCANRFKTPANKAKRTRTRNQLQCSICDKMCATVRNLKRHRERHHPATSGLQKCVTCAKSFATLEQLEQHLWQQQREQPKRRIECCLCGVKFETLAQLRAHLTQHADGSTGVNMSAGQYFKVHWPEGCVGSESVVARNIAAEFAVQNFAQFYAAVDESGNELDLYDSDTDAGADEGDGVQQQQQQQQSALYTCDLCGVSFGRRKSILLHQQGEHATPAQCLPHTCGDCGKQFVCTQLLEQHIKRDCSNAAKRFTCETCATRFVWERNLKRHMQWKHNVAAQTNSCLVAANKLQCDFCDKAFIWSKDLTRHRRVHMPDREQFECPFCERKFNRKDNMHAHLKVHSAMLASTDVAANAKKDSTRKSTKVEGVDPNFCKPHGCKHIQCKICLSHHSKIIDLRTHLREHQKTVSLAQHTQSINELWALFYPDELPMSKAYLIERIMSDIASAQQLERFYSITTELGYELSVNNSETESDSDGETNTATASSAHGGNSDVQHVYSCDLCTATFTRKYKLFAHQQAVHEWQQAPHECSHCGARFLCAQLLQLHQQQLCKNTLKRHLCRKCPQRFMWKENLKTHLRLLHTDSDDIRKLGSRTFDCAECARKFQMQKDLTRHMLTHRSDIFAFTCLWCPRKFYREENLHMHLRWHGIMPEQLDTARCHISATNEPNGTKQICCRICDLQFNSVSVLRAHLAQPAASMSAQHYEYNSLNNYSITNELGFELQIDDSDTDDNDEAAGVAGYAKQYKCDLCNLICKRRYEMARHQLSMHKPEQLPFKCPKCIFKTVSQNILQHHIRTQCYNTEKQYRCEKCSFRFMWPENLQIHMQKLHAPAPPAIAPAPTLSTATATSTANTNNQVASNTSTGTNDKIFQCDKCHRCYNRKDRLTAHFKKAHSAGENNGDKSTAKNGNSADGSKADDKSAKPAPAEKRFLCAFCGRAVTSSSNLIIHMRRHTGEKPFKCDLCDKAFPRSSDLLCHRRTHTGEKPHTCTVCNKAFSRSYKLQTHMRIHSGERPYKCTYCEKSFTQSNDLTLHIRRHTGERPYVCGICGERFIQGTALKNHRTMRGHYEDVGPPNTSLLQQF